MLTIGKLFHTLNVLEGTRHKARIIGQEIQVFRKCRPFQLTIGSGSSSVGFCNVVRVDIVVSHISRLSQSLQIGISDQPKV